MNRLNEKGYGLKAADIEDIKAAANHICGRRSPNEVFKCQGNCRFVIPSNEHNDDMIRAIQVRYIYV
jgi:hypothetical protein